jgi:hypothetical protein
MHPRDTQEVDLTVLVEVPSPDGGITTKRLMDLTPEDLAAMAIQHRTRAAEEARRRSSASLDFREELATAGPAAPPAEPVAPPTADVWEHTEVVIPLGLEAPKGSDAFPDAFRTRFEVLVQEALLRPRLDGWQPDGPIGLRALGPEQFKTTPVGLWKSNVRYESVTLRLKRPRRA